MARRYWKLLSVLAVPSLWIAGGVRQTPMPTVLTSTVDPAAVIFDVQTPSAPHALHIALSPDGRDLVTWVSVENALALWLRPLDGLPAATIPGSEIPLRTSIALPFWSPDGRSIAFFGSNKLMRIERSGGPAQPLADAPFGHGGSWGRSGVIVYAPNNAGPLYSISANGGRATQVTALDQSRQEIAHRHPYFLPDGRHFLYIGVSSKPENSAIWAGSLDSGSRIFIMNSRTKAEFELPDTLFYMKGTILMVQPFDPDRLLLTGDAVPIVQNVGINTTNSLAAFTTSESGALAYRGTTPTTDIASRPITIVVNWKFLRSPLREVCISCAERTEPFTLSAP